MGDSTTNFLASPEFGLASAYLNNAGIAAGNIGTPYGQQRQPNAVNPLAMQLQRLQLEQLKEAAGEKKQQKQAWNAFTTGTPAVPGVVPSYADAPGREPVEMGGTPAVPSPASALGLPPSLLALLNSTGKGPELAASAVIQQMKPKEPYSLSPGMRRFDSSNKEVASVPDAPDYKERQLSLPDGSIQMQFSRDKGMRWENIGAPYDRRDPFIMQQELDTNGNLVTKPYSRAAAAAAAAAGTTLGPGRPTPEKIKQDEAVKKLGTMSQNLADYREALREYGVSLRGAVGIPPAKATELGAKAEALRLDLKTLYELGALVGGDFVILDRLLTNPLTQSGVQVGKEGLLKQLDSLETQLGRKLKEKGIDMPPLKLSGEELRKKYGKMTDDEIQAEHRRQSGQ